MAIIGSPNVGKSTLLNQLVGEKLAGVTSKPQTTRGVIRGIRTQPEGQIVFLDTPGYHKPHDALGKWMIREIEKTLPGADLLYWMVLPYVPSAEEKTLAEKLRSVKTLPVFLLINQIDRFRKPQILPVLEAYRKLFDFRELIPISAKTGEQIPLLIRKTYGYLPENEYFFPDDQVSDQHQRHFVQEIIREKIFLSTGREVPYSTSVMIDSFKERDEKLVHIQATIITEKQSQKAILIGKQGQKLKQIGQRARLDLEKFLGRKVFLQLWVKVLPHWKRDENLLDRLGYKHQNS